MINGIVNVYKPQGFTSFDVVAKLRGIFKQKKVGHTGTLDPDATGVLPVCLGNATRVCELLTDKDKTYETVMVLGISTDTQDLSGQVTDRRKVDLSEAEVRDAVLSFVGEYEQVPPMFSAKKVDGKRLYELAREGKVVERKSCLVKINDIEILGMDLSDDASFDFAGRNVLPISPGGMRIGPYVHMKVSCSKGTYIRTLCDDIGNKLSCGASMAGLTRVQVGPFAIGETYTMDELSDIVAGVYASGDLPSLFTSGTVRSVDSVFMQYESGVVKADSMKKLLNGNVLETADFVAAPSGDNIRIYDGNEIFYAIYKRECSARTGGADAYVPLKMFLPQEG